jgi:DNA invertase Pin-like site-specific DNA recombinase
MVSKLDRLSRSVLDFAAAMERSRKEGGALVVLDSGVDTSTPQGKLLHNVMACFAEFERELIGAERVKTSP